MSDNPLSSKVGLDVTDFKTAISEMNRDLRVVESGFRASAASLGDWASSIDGLEMRSKSLNEEIKIQQGIVAALSTEYQRAAEAKGKDSIEAEGLQIKLNKANEALGKMQSELGTTTQSLDEMRSGSNEAGSEVDELGNQSEQAGSQADQAGEEFKGFQGYVVDLASAAQLAIDGIKMIGDAISGAISGMKDLVLETAAAADELVTMSAKTGLSTERLQEFNYISDQVGTSTETITGSLARLVRSMDSARSQQEDYNEALGEAVTAEDKQKVQLGEMAQAFATLGVSTTDASGNLRDNQAVFADVLDALGGIENSAERDALAMQIFGKSAQELNPLIKTGSEGLAELAAQAHEVGAVVDGETVDAFAGLADQVDSLKAAGAGLLTNALAPLLPMLTDLGTQAQEAFGKIGEALERLQAGNVKGALRGILPPDLANGLIGLYETIQKTLGSPEVSGILAGLQQAFDNMALFWQENGPGISAIAQEMLGTLIRLFSEVGDVIVNQVMPFVVEQIEKFSAWFVENGPLIQAFLKEVGNLFSEFSTLIVDVLTVAFAVLSPLIGGIVSLVLGLGKTFMQMATGDWAGAWETIKATVKGAMEAIGDAFEGLANFVLGWMGTSWSQVQATWSENWEMFKQIVTLGWDAIKKSFADAWEKLKTTLTTLIDNIKNAWDEIDWAGIGSALIGRIAGGITGGLNVLKNAALAAAKAALEAAMSWLGGGGSGDTGGDAGAGGGSHSGATSANPTFGPAPVFGKGEQQNSVTNIFNLTAQYGFESEDTLSNRIGLLQILAPGWRLG